MRLIIVNYRLGGKRSYPSQVILQPEEDAYNYSIIGKKVEFIDKYGNIYRGTIVRKHGKRGYIAIFKPNLPPTALGGRAFLKEKD